jgi:predicted branched-subunit amino acid permease
MKVPDIDQPVRLTCRYGVGYAVIAGPTFWVVNPWTWDLPVIAKVTGVIVLPAVTLILIFFPALFVASLIKNFSRQKRMVIRLIAALAVFGLGLLFNLVLLDLGPAPSLVAAIAALIVYHLVHPGDKPAANQTTQSQRASGPRG